MFARVLAALIALVGVTCTNDLCASPIRTVLLSGQTLQGLPNGHRVAAIQPRVAVTPTISISPSGVVSGATYIDGDQVAGWAAWTEVDGKPTVRLIVGQHVNVSGQDFTITSAGIGPQFTQTGSALHTVQLQAAGGAAKYALIKSAVDGTLSPLLIEGDVMPPSGGHWTFTPRDQLDAVVNDFGDHAVLSDATGSLGSLAVRNRNLWINRGDEYRFVATADRFVTQNIQPTDVRSLGTPLLNSRGQIAYTAQIGQYWNDSLASVVMKQDEAGDVQLVAQSGLPAPGVGVGALFSSTDAYHFEPLNLDSSGQVAFLSYFTEVNRTYATFPRGIWRGTTSADLEPVIVTGDHAPGFPTTHRVLEMSGLLMNDVGEVVFGMGVGVGKLNANGNPEGGVIGGCIVAGHDKSDFRLVTAPRPAPEFGDGYYFTPLGRGALGVPGLAINGAGQVAFGGLVESPEPASVPIFGIWADDRAQRLRLIVRTGEWLDVDDGPGEDLRQVKSVDFLSNAAAGSMPHDGFNDAGQLAFTATFTDGTGGVFVSNLATVAEPAAAGISIAALAFLLLRRTHGRLPPSS